ncbi:hypothetical protein, variant [Exophiala oligosperma]|uniref:NmrA-like domain-containing protein n=1 Tax=Exophiala oligosperma TaxID=215243 RepID=A0A0D2AYK7_9EURO|nr:hypothetical protein, variant [Exophiala oligosperma]KIW44906.1 hypothetical protein, variant [Exophiala oligosperma]
MVVEEGPLRNVVVFGAGGTNIGHHLVKALLSQPESFTVTIIARKSSKSRFPEGAKVVYVDDSLPHEELVNAMHGADAVVSAIGYGSISAEEKLIDAAIDAKVKRFLPSEFGVNNTNAAARALSPVFDAKGGVIDLLRSKEATGFTWTAVPTGLWLDWALEPAIAFANINIQSHTATLWADGNHALSWTTLPWAAHGITQVLLSPSKTANKVVPIRGFEASQKDIIAMLEKEQNVTYNIEHFNPDDAISKAQSSWRENKDIPSALQLVQAGFFLDGYGSDLVGEGIVQTGNEYLNLPELRVEEVVKKAVAQWA